MRSRPGPILVLCFLCITLAGISQVQSSNSNYNPVLANTGQFGLTFGPAVYYGDLNTGHFQFKQSTGLAASLFGQYYFSNSFGFKVSLFSGLLNGGIKSYQQSGQQMEDSFTGIILEGNIQMVINFSNLFFGQSNRRRFFVYGSVGLGYAGWYSKLTNKVYNYDSIQTNNPLNNFNAALVIPAGLGFYYRIGNRMNLGLEYDYKTYFSDKLDNVAGGYPYDVVHYISLNISFNLGTGSAREHKNKPVMSMQLQPQEYPVSYPVYIPPVSLQTEENSLQPEAGSWQPAVSNRQPVISSRKPAVNSQQPEVSSRKPAVGRKKTAGCKLQTASSEAMAGSRHYSVQIFAFNGQGYSSARIKQKYHITEEIRVEKSGGVERFLVGRCADADCAKNLKEKMQRKGIHDAFIVVYQNGRRQKP